MLVLSRKNWESVVVGDPAVSRGELLKVTVLEIRGHEVKLGFEIGGDVPVNRWEVWKEAHSYVHPGHDAQAIEGQRAAKNIIFSKSDTMG
jgi:carbon storage regulator CsrA